MPDRDKEQPAPFGVAADRKLDRKRRRKSRPYRVQSWLQERAPTILTLLLTVVVGASLLAVGTVHVGTLLWVSPLATFAGLFALFIENRTSRRVMLPALITCALALYSFLQSVPLPSEYLKLLSPAASQIWRDAFVLAKLPANTWASISVDPNASRVEALKWLSYAAIYLAAAKLSRECGSKRGAMIVFGVALLGGVLSLAHGLAGMKEWFGLYQPQMANPPWALSPLLNPNNFAGYLNLALFAGLGLLFVREPPISRWTIGLGVVVLSALVILTASRGGVFALVAGFGLSGLALRHQQRMAAARGGFAYPRWIPIVAVSIASLGLAIIGATDLIWQQLLDETLGKLRMLEYSLPLARDHVWTGVGRGAFETAFAAYRKEPGNTIAQYAENFVIQWVVEWGLPVALLGLLGLSWCLRPWRLGFGRNSVPTGAIIGISTLLLQNLVDLATEQASVGIAVATLFGTLVGGSEYFAEHRLQERARRRTMTLASPRSKRLSARFSAGVTGLTLLPIGLLHYSVFKSGRPDAIDERWELARDLQNAADKAMASSDTARLSTRVITALLRHPADPYIPLVGAMLSRQMGTSALGWLNHALRRDPMNARAHLLLADTLAARGAMNQALQELRTATELGPELRGEICDRTVRWTRSIDELMRVVPEGKQGIPQLNALAQRYSGTPELQKKREELLMLSLKRNANDAESNAIFAWDLLAQLNASSGTCVGDGRAACESRLKRHVAAVTKYAADPQIPTILTARILEYEGKFDEAEQWLAARCRAVSDPVSCGAERIAAALKLKNTVRFDAAAADYATAACSTPAACSGAFAWLGTVELGRGNQLAALARFERSAQESPSAEGWLRVADIAMGLGRLGRAETALASARRLSAPNAIRHVDERIDSLRRSRLIDSVGRSRMNAMP